MFRRHQVSFAAADKTKCKHVRLILRTTSFHSVNIFSFARPERQDNKKEFIRKVNHQQKKDDATAAVPPTPSKNLFSPGLRTDVNPAAATRKGSAQDSPDAKESSHYDALISSAASSDDEGECYLAKVDEEEDEEAEGEEKGKVEEDEEVDDVFNPYYFIAGLPQHSSVTVKDKVCLPAATAKGLTSKTTLVLDLDETLVHCTVEPIEKPDLVFPVS